MLITISRQYAAGGSRVAKAVAERLGWRLVDNQLIDQVAERAGVPAEVVARREERAPSFVERLARVSALQMPELLMASPQTIGAGDEARLAEVTRGLVAELAQEGRCVVVGRASAAVLARLEDCLHVRLVAPRTWRIEVAVRDLGIAGEDAPHVVDEIDANRRRYHHEFYHRDSENPVHYDFVLNSARLGFDGATETIVHRAERLGWAPHT